MPKYADKNFISAEEQEKMIKENLDLPAIIANKHRQSYPDIDELISCGMMGLVKGAAGFNPNNSKGASPRTYLSLWVNAGIMKALYEKRHVHVPWNKINAVIKSNREGTTLDFELPREVNLNRYDNDGSDNSGKEVKANMRDKIESKVSCGLIQEREEVELREYIEFAIDNSALSALEYNTIVHRYGLKGEDSKTLEQVGEMLGLTAMGIKKAQDRALNKLRKADYIKELKI